MKIFVTGATGFIGAVACDVFEKSGHIVRRGVRIAGDRTEHSCHYGDLEQGWSREAVAGVDVVVHLAARVHKVEKPYKDSLDGYRETNSAGTERLAYQAARAGVRRFVYLSSIKVHGERTLNQCFSEADLPKPEDAYAISKWEAEQALIRISKETSMEIVVVRPPLVYGPGVKGNLRSLLGIVAREAPLPFGSVSNRRSLIGRDNLVDLLTLCVEHPDAAGQVFLASDGEDVSTQELVRILAIGMERRARLVKVPPRLLRFGWALVRRQAMCDRLCGSLVVDSSKARRVLGWTPRKPVKEGLMEMARWYLEQRSGFVKDAHAEV